MTTNEVPDLSLVASTPPLLLRLPACSLVILLAVLLGDWRGGEESFLLFVEQVEAGASTILL